MLELGSNIYKECLYKKYHHPVQRGSGLSVQKDIFSDGLVNSYRLSQGIELFFGTIHVKC